MLGFCLFLDVFVVCLNVFDGVLNYFEVWVCSAGFGVCWRCLWFGEVLGFFARFGFFGEVWRSTIWEGLPGGLEAGGLDVGGLEAGGYQ